ncbi:hypothetical protein [Thiolinea disciformis]|uniref:hypothetical protein n=1 Tax=Thiolinea disciformis TaxID=125614 RepID=UPI0003713D3A|nr:hypothetical protein [Thiolinea disciformis]
MNSLIIVAIIVILIAAVVLYLDAKRVARGESAGASLLPLIKWPLLLASAGFNCFFTYNVFSAFHEGVALFAAVVMGGVTLAEAFLVRLIIAAWRHRFTFIYRMALVLAIPLFGYSLMAADSSFHAMLNKNQSVHLATQLELSASNDRIKQAEWQARQAEIDARKENRLNTYYSESATLANANASGIAANEKRLQAQLLREQAPEINPNLLGFSLAASVVGLIVSLALEGAIIGVGFFEELFIRPTPLPALIQFMNKTLDWNISEAHQKPLQVEMSPSPSVLTYVNQKALAVTIPAPTALVPSVSSVGFGWQSHQPTRTTLPSALTERSTHSELPALPNVKTGSEPNASGYVGLAHLPNAGSAGGDIATAPQSVQEGAFQEWLTQVRSGLASPTMQPTKQFISERKLAKGIKLIAAMADDWLDRAYNLGVLDDNPDYSNGKPRYILAGQGKPS